MKNFSEIHPNKKIEKSGLPEPVYKYINHVLNEDQRMIKSVRLSHGGYFKTSAKSNWTKINGKQYFNLAVPGFKWVGKTNLFKAIDKFENGKGQLKVKLFSFIPIVNVSGSHVDQAELLRWLGESVWFPTNLLPSKNFSWEAINSSTSKLIYTYDQLTIYYIVTFNEKDEITQLETKRYKEKGHLEKWIGKVSNYKEFDGIKVPTHIEAIWSLDSGNFKYADFYVDSIEYKY